MTVLRIPADVRNLAEVRKFVREQAERAGAPSDAIADVVQAVDESVTNCIVHGYRGTQGTVEVEVQRDGSALIVKLRDQARPFDPTSVPSRDIERPLAEQPLGGMGVHLTRELTDSITYRHTGAGNELTLTKDCIGQAGGHPG